MNGDFEQGLNLNRKSSFLHYDAVVVVVETLMCQT